MAYPAEGKCEVSSVPDEARKEYAVDQRTINTKSLPADGHLNDEPPIDPDGPWPDRVDRGDRRKRFGHSQPMIGLPHQRAGMAADQLIDRLNISFPGGLSLHSCGAPHGPRFIIGPVPDRSDARCGW